MNDFKTIGQFLRSIKDDAAPIGDTGGGFLVPPVFYVGIREASYNTYRSRWERLAAIWSVLRGRSVMYRVPFGEDQLQPPAGVMAIGCVYVKPPGKRLLPQGGSGTAKPFSA